MKIANIIILLIVLISLFSFSVQASKVGDAFKSGLGSIENFLGGGWKAYEKTVAFVVFFFLFFSAYLIGARKVFGENGKLSRSHITFAFVAALLSALIVISTMKFDWVNLRYVACFLVSVLVLYLIYSLFLKLGFEKHKVWAFILALLITALIMWFLCGFMGAEGRPLFKMKNYFEGLGKGVSTSKSKGGGGITLAEPKWDEEKPKDDKKEGTGFPWGRMGGGAGIIALIILVVLLAKRRRGKKPKEPEEPNYIMTIIILLKEIRKRKEEIIKALDKIMAKKQEIVGDIDHRFREYFDKVVEKDRVAFLRDKTSKEYRALEHEINNVDDLTDSMIRLERLLIELKKLEVILYHRLEELRRIDKDNQNDPINPATLGGFITQFEGLYKELLNLIADFFNISVKDKNDLDKLKALLSDKNIENRVLGWWNKAHKNEVKIRDYLQNREVGDLRALHAKIGEEHGIIDAIIKLLEGEEIKLDLIAVNGNKKGEDSPHNIPINVPVNFECNIGNGAPDKYEWFIQKEREPENTLGGEQDFTAGNPMRASYTFNQDGTYNIRVVVRKGGVDRAVRKAIVKVERFTLKAEITRPPMDAPDASAILARNKDVRIEGTVNEAIGNVTWNWRLVNIGGNTVRNGNTPRRFEFNTAAPTPLEPGEYTVNLDVVDGRGVPGHAERKVWVELDVKVTEPPNDAPDPGAIVIRGVGKRIKIEIVGGSGTYQCKYKVDNGEEETLNPSNSPIEFILDKSKLRGLGGKIFHVDVKDSDGLTGHAERKLGVVKGKEIDKYNEKKLIFVANRGELIGKVLVVKNKLTLGTPNNQFKAVTKIMDKIDSSIGFIVFDTRINDRYFNNKRFDVPQNIRNRWPENRKNNYAIFGMNLSEVYKYIGRIHKKFNEGNKWVRCPKIVKQVAVLARKKGNLKVGLWNEVKWKNGKRDTGVWKGFQNDREGETLINWASNPKKYVKNQDGNVVETEAELTPGEKNIVNIFSYYTLLWYVMWNYFELGIWQMNRLIDKINEQLRGEEPVIEAVPAQPQAPPTNAPQPTVARPGGNLRRAEPEPPPAPEPAPAEEPRMDEEEIGLDEALNDLE